MAADYPSAVRNGTMAAGRLHRELDVRTQVEKSGGNVDVFGTFQAVNLPLLVRPLKGLLGAYLREPSPGVLVTSQRPLSIQRWTAAHELGHYTLKHRPSLDDENILRRMPLSAPPAGGDFQEDEANAFAIAFMMPRWLIVYHAQRQGWTAADFRRPAIVYQLSLRIGASYEATCWTLARYRFFPIAQAKELLKTEPRDIKIGLLGPHRPSDYRGDVWLLTEHDAGAQIDGSRNDHFVLRLHEHSGGGYLWDIDQLKESGFAIVRNETESLDDQGVGAHVVRRVTGAPEVPQRGKVSLDERRPWESDTPIATLELEYDFTGPEQEGLSRAERRSLFAQA